MDDQQVHTIDCLNMIPVGVMDGGISGEKVDVKSSPSLGCVCGPESGVAPTAFYWTIEGGAQRFWTMGLARVELGVDGFKGLNGELLSTKYGCDEDVELFGISV